MSKSRGQWCGDIGLPAYLSNVTGPVSLVLDLRIPHDRWASTSNPSINGNLHYPTDIHRTLNETTTDKILQYRVDYNNRPSHAISFMTVIDSTSGCLHGEYVWLLFGQVHRGTDRFLASSGVQLAQANFHFRRAAYSSQLKSKVGNRWICVSSILTGSSGTYREG